MKYVPLVWAALWRKPAEAILTGLAVTAAFTLLNVMIGVNITIRQIVERAPMDRLWVGPRFQSLGPPYGFPQALGGQLARMDGVIAVAASQNFSGYHVDPHNWVGIQFVDDKMGTVWSEGSISPGQWDELSAMPSGLLISDKAASKWGLKKDDTFVVITDRVSRIDGGNSWDFKVLEVVRDDWDRSGDDGFIIGNLKYLENAEPLAARGWGYSYELAVNDAGRAMEISSRIDRQFANSATATLTIPKRVNEQTYVNRGVSTAALTSAIAVAGLSMILLLAGNAIARSVRERIPEFAVLQTIGFRHRHLVLLVLIEAAIPCLVGALISTLFADALEAWSQHFLPPVLVTFLSTPMPRLALLGWTLGLALMVATASSAMPIWKLRRQSVTDALAGR